MGAAAFDKKQMTFRGMNAMSLDQYAASVAMQIGAARGTFDNLCMTMPDERASGVGLGLPLCEQLLRLMGTRCTVSQPESGGSIFSFVVRLKFAPYRAPFVDSRREMPRLTGRDGSYTGL